MPDIAKCKGSGRQMVNGGQTPPVSDSAWIDCPMKETCYRFVSKPSDFRQTYFADLPLDPTTNTCKYFMPVWQKQERPNGSESPERDRTSADDPTSDRSDNS